MALSSPQTESGDPTLQRAHLSVLLPSVLLEIPGWSWHRALYLQATGPENDRMSNGHGFDIPSDHRQGHRSFAGTDSADLAGWPLRSFRAERRDTSRGIHRQRRRICVDPEGKSRRFCDGSEAAAQNDVVVCCA